LITTKSEVLQAGTKGNDGTECMLPGAAQGKKQHATARASGTVQMQMTAKLEQIRHRAGSGNNVRQPDA